MPIEFPLRMRPAGRLVCFFASGMLVFAAANWWAGSQRLPNYGTWTGVATIEAKLKLLEDYAAAGPIDAVIFGSSLADHGLSAAELARQLSQIDGRRWRIFNFSTGAGDWQLFPALYRFVRLVIRPKLLIIAHGGHTGTGDGKSPIWPQVIMRNAPIGSAIDDQTRLRLSASIWRTRLAGSAGAMRDWAFFGKYANWRPSHLEIYGFNPEGDTISFMFAREKQPVRSFSAARKSMMIGALQRHREAKTAEQRRDVYFHPNDLIRMQELGALAREDGCRIVLARQDGGSGYLIDGAEYLESVRAFMSETKAILGASEVYLPLLYRPEPYEIEDDQHINEHAAIRTARHLAAVMRGKPEPPPPVIRFWEFESLEDRDKWHPNVAVVIREASQNEFAGFSAKYHFSSDSRPLTLYSQLYVALTDWQGRDHISPAKATSDRSITARFTDLPPDGTAFPARLLEPVGAQLRPILMPLDSYQWEKN